jgi:hypothetical protein
MKVKLLRDIRDDKAGDEIELPDEVAGRWIHHGYCEPVVEKTTKAPKNRMVKTSPVRKAKRK